MRLQEVHVCTVHIGAAAGAATASDGWSTRSVDAGLEGAVMVWGAMAWGAMK